MKVNELMCPDVIVCHPDTPLSEVARIMWERDIGFLPVTDPGTEELRGVVTDRDACMAAYSQGRALRDIPTEVAMAREVFTCRQDDDLAALQDVMRGKQIRRVPVIDRQRRLVGVVSLTDLARRSTAGRPTNLVKDVTVTLASVGQPRAQSANAVGERGAEGKELPSPLQ